jgi:hypothetical protein
MESTFTSSCEGIGLALAVGLVIGALAGAAMRQQPVLAIVAAVAGAVVFAAALNSNDHELWPGLVAGPLCAALAFILAASVVAGAARRRGAGAATLAGYVVVVGFIVAGLALVVEPVSLAVLVAVVALVLARRGREGRKYEGLRVLR